MWQKKHKALKPIRRWPERGLTAVYPFSATSQHPSFVKEGFVREDMMRAYGKLPVGKPFEAGTVFLTQDAVPCVGMYVKVQLICEPVWNEEFKEQVSNALLGGRITEVKGPRRVVAAMTVTNMSAPFELECAEWSVELVFRTEFRHPWVVDGMRKVKRMKTNNKESAE